MSVYPDTPPELPTTRLDAADVVVPVLAEQLRVSYRWVETGHAMRVRKLVREQARDLELPAWREQVRITRRCVAETRVEPVTLRHEVVVVEGFDPASVAWVEVPIEPSATAGGASIRQAEAPTQAPVAGPNSTPPRPRIPIMYTVIGAFDDRSTAQRTVDLLATRGFSRDAIDLQARPDTLDPTTGGATSTSVDPDTDTRRDQDDGFLAGVRNFFSSLFGTDEERHIGIYSEAIRRGSTLVVVDARDQAEADRAAEAMREQGGTIDLDERSTAWRAEGWGVGTPHAATGGTAGAMAAQALVDDDRIAPTAQGNRERSSDTLTDAERKVMAGSTEGDVVLPVVQEEVKIGKRSVDQGGVRVVRRVTETPVSELVRLRAERVEDNVRRTDVEIDRLSRQADDALGRATGDAYDEDDELARTPNTTPRTGERGRTQTPAETRRKT